MNGDDLFVSFFGSVLNGLIIGMVGVLIGAMAVAKGMQKATGKLPPRTLHCGSCHRFLGRLGNPPPRVTCPHCAKTAAPLFS